MRHSADPWEALACDVARLGVAAACRLHGIHRSTWYRKAQAARERQSLPGPAPELVAGVLAIALERPEWGCDRIAYFLRVSGIRSSSPTVQKILIAQSLGRRSQRLERARAAASSPDRPSPGEP